MKSLKRVFALAVVFAMVLSSISMAMAAKTFEDVAGDDINVVNTLVGLGLIEGYEEDGKMLFKGDQTITRAEFATIVCRLIGMGDAAASTRSTDFTDVPASHWASGYVQTAADTNGIIAGYGDGTFGPEDKVTYEQAVKMIVCALGYQTKAEEEGTYPAGYLFVARTAGLTDGVTGTVGQEATRMTVGKLLYNSLNTPLMQKIVSGTKSSYYGIFDGEEYTPKKTVLSEYLGAVKVTGILSNNSISTESLRDDQVQIDIDDNYGSRVVYSNTSYIEGSTITAYVGDTAAKDLLGKKVEAYLTYETSANNDPTVLAIFESTNESKKLTVEFEDIREMVNNGSSYAVKYWTDKDNNKSTTVYVDTAATYYINGEKASYKTADLKAAVDNGNFVSSNAYVVIDFSLVGKTTGDYDYDYAFINVYENFVVDSVDEVGEKVYAGTDSPSGLTYIEYDADADYELALADVDGAEVEPTALAEYDVVTMQVNPYNWKSMSDIKAIDAVVVKKAIDGTITEINSVDGEYYIDDVAYEIDPAAVLTLMLDDAGTFYLDVNDKIVAFDQTSGKNSQYAVIVNKAPTAGVDTAYQVKMFTSEGALEVRDLAAKVKMPVYDYVDTNNDTKPDTYMTVTTSYDDDAAYAKIPAAPAVCSYKLNSAGEVSSLSFASTTYKATAATAKSAALVANSIDAANGEIEAEGKEIKRVDAGSKYYMDEDTKILAVETMADYSTAKLDNFELYTVDELTTDQKFASISVYDVDTNNYASLVVIKDADVSLSSDAINVVMVKTVNDVNNTEGDATVKISGYNNAGAVSAIVDDETVVSLDAGEVFFPKSANANGEIKKLIKVTEKKADGTFGLTAAFKTAYEAMIADDSDSTFYFGKVDYKQKNTIYFTNILDEQNNALATKAGESIVIPNSAAVMVYDASRASTNKVSYETAGYMSYSTKANADGSYNISNEDIKSYYILVREYNGAITDVVYYCYTTDAATPTLPSASVSTSNVVVEDVVVDAIINEEFVIAE